ncbi:MAG: preprotein translocase YidC [Bacillaceae bacterium G1]|nr:MAG: preprotein translocase YidC [Bacillaceae bacterium G1]
MFKRSGAWLSLLLLVLLLTGCSPEAYMKPIDPNGGIWDRYFVFPLSWTLDTVADWLAGSYGLSILVVTLIIRFIILPLMYKQMKSSKQLQELQPEIQKLQKKYKNNQEKLQLEMMKLFQKHNVNPLMGCLPILIQMPILIAFYHAIMRNAEIREHSFLWMNLGTPDPFYVLPALAALTTYFQTMVTRKMMPTPQVMTVQMEQQQQMMKTMSIILPAMILFIAITLPSALSLYWVYTNVFSIIQTYFLYKWLYGEKVQKEATS